MDFSGARDAGRHAWWARGTGADGALTLTGLERGDALPGSAPERSRFLAALRARITHLGGAAIGFDFPFGLPAALMTDASWYAFVTSFAARFDSPEAFRAWCRARTGGRELRRATDVDARTPFAAWNLRLYRQTYWGIAGVLAPLVASGAAVAPPMQRRRAGMPWLLEACPASTLKRLGLYRPYKGRGAGLRSARRELVTALTGLGLMAAPRRLVTTLIEDPGGDALDAALAACATARAVARPHFPHTGPRHRLHRLEAVVWY